MNREDFSEDEWQDVFDEFRLLVIRAGYSDWDASAMEALADERDERDERDTGRIARPGAMPPVEQLRRYAAAFMRFLKVRSPTVRDERLGQLGKLLHTESGQPVEDFIVAFDGRHRAIFEGDDDPVAMIDLLKRFLDELSGEDSAFWDEEPGSDEAGT